MADADPRHRSLTAPGIGSAAAIELVVSALEGRPGLEVREVAPGRIGVARTRRPRWALIACALTFWLGGLGLLFLLVKETEAGEITVSDAPQGCVVVVPPILRGSVTEAIEAALRGPDARRTAPAPAFPHRSGEAADVDDHLDTRTVARQDRPQPSDPEARPDRSPEPDRKPEPEPEAPAPPASTMQLVLRFDDGRIAVAAGEQVVLGRDPSPRPSARPEVVPGDASSVSKSHLLVVNDGLTATVEDLGSTNGSALLRGARPVPLEPGFPVEVVDGELLVVGAVSCTVEVEVPGSERATTTGTVR